MKKLILVLVVSLVLVFAVSYVSLADVTVKAGYDLGGTLSSVGSVPVDGGLSLGFEYTSEISDNLIVGGGLEYQLLRKVNSSPYGISCIPIYGLVQYKFSEFYAVGRFGYNLSSTDVPLLPGETWGGGIYYGVGAGMNIGENMVVEAVYGVCGISDSYMGITLTGTYSKIGLSFGYKF